MWDTVAEAHAALNDLPAALLVLSVTFDLAGMLTKRESLRAAGFWTLVAGAVGGGLAVLTGLKAEATIEHGGAVHTIMERHESLAIAVTVLFGLLAAWRLWRRDRLGPAEQPVYLTVAVLGAGLLFYVGSLGGQIVFRHAGGIPTPVLESAIVERAAGHEHGPGEEHDHGAATPVDSAGAAGQASGAGDHDHPAGTPPHDH